jgi:hypothetical protein
MNYSRVLIGLSILLALSGCAPSGVAPQPPTVTLIPSPLPPTDSGGDVVPAATIEQPPVPTAVPINPNVTPIVPTETVCEFNAAFVSDLSIPLFFRAFLRGGAK